MRAKLVLFIAIGAGTILGIASDSPAGAAATGVQPDSRIQPAIQAQSFSQPQAAAPAAQGGSDPSTTLTFTVTSGALSITAPTAADLGSGAPGTTIGPTAVGAVNVTDNRALASATWTVSAGETDFTTGTATPAETIPATTAAYTVGTITHTGTITTTGTDLSSMSNTAATVVAGTAGVGDNTASWNPTIAVHVPAAAVGGSYTGTLTHSVL